MRAVNANAYCDCDSYNTTIPVTYTIDTGIAYPDDTTIPDSYAERHNPAIANTSGNGDPHGNNSSKGNTKASSDSSSSTVTFADS